MQCLIHVRLHFECIIAIDSINPSHTSVRVGMSIIPILQIRKL